MSDEDKRTEEEKEKENRRNDHAKLVKAMAEDQGRGRQQRARDWWGGGVFCSNLQHRGEKKSLRATAFH